LFTATLEKKYANSKDQMEKFMQQAKKFNQENNRAVEGAFNQLTTQGTNKPLISQRKLRRERSSVILFENKIPPSLFISKPLLFSRLQFISNSLFLSYLRSSLLQ